MFDIALRDVSSHKARTFLTTLGIIIAITAIVSLGSISSGLNELIQGQLNLVSGIILVEEKNANHQGPPTGAAISMDDVETIRSMSGVEKIGPSYFAQLGDWYIIGGTLDAKDLIKLDDIPVDGRWPESGEYAAVVGSEMADIGTIRLGDKIEFKGKELIVVGILDKMETFIDYGTITSIEVLQEIMDDPDHVSSMTVKPTDLSEAASIADEIEKEFPNLDASTEEENRKRAEEMIGQVRIFTLGIALVSSLVAAIGIINTMFMSITEKQRDLGIMKAIGASQKQIMIQVLEESFIYSILGGIVGLLLGYAGAAAVSSAMNVPFAKVTPELAVGSFAFAVAITLLSAIYPARVASKVDPIKAIRRQL